MFQMRIHFFVFSHLIVLVYVEKLHLRSLAGEGAHCLVFTPDIFDKHEDIFPKKFEEASYDKRAPYNLGGMGPYYQSL